jgi:hypothetical protein
MAWTKKGGGGPLLLHYVIQIRRKGSGVVDRGQGSCRLDQLDKLIAVRSSPLVAEGTSKSRTKGEGLPKLVQIQHRG